MLGVNELSHIYVDILYHKNSALNHITVDHSRVYRYSQNAGCTLYIVGELSISKVVYDKGAVCKQVHQNGIAPFFTKNLEDFYNATSCLFKKI